MKRFNILALFGLGFCSVALAAPQEIYQNFGPITNVPQIDAITFYNASIFDLNTVVSLTNIQSVVSAGFSSIPYSPNETLYYTNTTSGSMSGVPGFLFDTVTATSRHSASSFVNDGSITGLDYQAFPEVYSTTAGTTALVADSQAVASQVEVLATNIMNDGTISVGNYGLLKMVGKNITSANGALVAGGINTGGGFDADPLDTTSQNELFNFDFNYYVNAPGVYDLYWGVTNGVTLDVSAYTPLDTPGIDYIERPEIIGGDFPLFIEEENPDQFQVYVYQSYGASITNIEYNIVYVNTNFTDVDGNQNTNISVAVEFTDEFLLPKAQTGDIYAWTAMVQFATTVPDVISGQSVTNAIYLVDQGAAVGTMVDYDNAGSSDGYNRPNAFFLSTTTPDVWPGFASNSVYDPTVIYAADSFVNKKVNLEAAEYGAQIGRNPAEVDGSFVFPISFLGEISVGTNTYTNLDTGLSEFEGSVSLPDPTNEPARIELTAAQLDLSNARLRAEGLVTINASNMVGTSAGTDWGEINSQLGATNGSLVVSNFFPTTFQRLRGNIYAWSGTFQNSSTNSSSLFLVSGSYTNTITYHVLVVGQNLGSKFQSAVRNLSLTGTNSIDVRDSLYVINQSYFNTSNLTFNSNTVFTQNAGNFTTPANAPKLKYLLNNTNANLAVDGLLNLGFNVTKSAAPPANRKYTVLGVTNFGSITATTPLIQSENFENDGTIVADNNGTIIIEAASLGLGLALTNSTNYLLSDENITLSAITMGFSNAQVFAGGSDATGEGQLLLQTTSGGQITDFASGAPATNAYVTNRWQVTGGFSLPVLPASGDLFGTEITTIATNFTVAMHTWAGVDYGATAAGFSDNMVIGHLKLSRQSSGAELHFTGAGAQNGMYVDYLELDTNSLSFNDYKEGLVIDPNLTIYFAACNLDPIKLQTIYTNRLVWVPSFAGPNSTVAVPYLDSTNVCLMNRNLADSPDIAFFGNLPNAFNQPYVLNDPSNPTNVYPCPSTATAFKDFIFTSTAGSNISLEISTVGGGSVSPSLKQSEIAMGKTYTLKATPAEGWVFAGWSASALPADADATSPTIRFTLQSNLILTANFTPKTFTLVKGTYYGLFLDTNSEPTSDNSGWFTLTVGSDGTYSGRLLMGPANYSFSSTFASNGSSQVVARRGGGSVTVNLQLDLTGQSGQVTGYVADPANVLLGNLAPVWTAKTASPYAGQYTMVLTNGGKNTAPAGDGYGSVTISKLGMLSVAGELADGDSFSQSVPISKEGLWPFYAYAAGGGDMLLGWIAFQGNDVNGFNVGETNLFWSKPPSAKGGYYSAGFSNTVNLIGSRYANPGADSSGLALADPVVILSGGGLAEPSTNAVSFNGKLKYSTNDLSLSISPATGSFSGQVKNAEDGAIIKLNGVVLQNQESAFGFFMGTNGESGAVLLQSQ